MHDAFVIRPERPERPVQPEGAFSEVRKASRIVDTGDCGRMPDKVAGGAPCSERKRMNVDPDQRRRSGAARRAVFSGCPDNRMSVFYGKAP